MAEKEQLERLRSVRLFEGLSDRELKDILGRSREVVHPAGRDIVEEGGGSAGFHLILDGKATVIRGGEVRGSLGKGDYFGEISLLDGKPRSATVKAEGEVRTLSLTAWQFEPMLQDHPKLAHKLLLGLCAHVRAAEASSVVD
jgi:CRP/FNR family transcriptional regulator, cyclic AMP receptor protein